MKHSNTKLKPSKRSVATVYGHPADTSADRDYPFLFVSLTGEPGDVRVTNPKRFDVKGTFTPRALRLVPDDDLRDFIVDEYSTCGGIPTRTAENTYLALVTKHRISDRGKPQKQVVAKIGINQGALTEGSTTGVGIAMGAADGDNDGTYESFDTACTGGAQTALWTKPVSSSRAKPRAEQRELLEQANGR